MSECPYVSVIVPVYNGEKTIDNCLESLAQQDYPGGRYEVIVVDNNSSDSTAAIVQQYPVVLLNEQRINSSYAARNTGVEAAAGSILAFTDADCIPHIDWLKKGVKPFEEAEVGGVAGEILGCEVCTPIERYLRRRNWLSQQGTLKHPFLPYAQTANAFYRSEVFNQIGHFEDQWVSAGDADFCWRMQRRTMYRLVFCEEAKVGHRNRSDLISIFKQTMKWGIGDANLQSKYSDYANIRGGRIDTRKIRLIARNGLIFGARWMQERFAGRPFERRTHYAVFLASKTGFVTGQIRGAIWGNPERSKDW